MKKLIILISILGAVSLCCAQTPGTVTTGPGNTAGILYASSFGQWSVTAGNQGQFSWSSPSFCTVTAAGIPLSPVFAVGTPVLIKDQVTANSETVTPSAVNVGGAGCSITVSPANHHNTFVLSSGTAGLQEAINYAHDLPYEVILTPDWSRLGGITSMIATARGNSNVQISDQRSACIIAYIWSGSSYVSQPSSCSGGGGGVGPGTAGYVPVFTGTTTLGDSLADYGVTTSGSFTFPANTNTPSVNLLPLEQLPNGIVSLGIPLTSVNLSGSDVIAIGTSAESGEQPAAGNTGQRVIALGIGSATNNQGNDVIALGNEADYQTPGGPATGEIVALGMSACHLDTGSNVVCIGNQTGFQNSGSLVAAIGTNAAERNSGNVVAALGENTALVNSGNMVVAVGDNASEFNSGDAVIAIGDGILNDNAASQVIGIGQNVTGGNSGDSLQLGIGWNIEMAHGGSNNIAIGNNAGPAGAPYSGSIAIGDTARNTATGQTVIGNSRATEFPTTNLIMYGPQPSSGGPYCLQIDSTGSVTSTGAACGSGGGVSQIIAGTNVSISPAGGTGVVTVNASGGGGGYPGCTADGSNGIVCTGQVQGNPVKSTANSVGVSIENMSIGTVSQLSSLTTSNSILAVGSTVWVADGASCGDFTAGSGSYVEKLKCNTLTSGSCSAWSVLSCYPPNTASSSIPQSVSNLVLWYAADHMTLLNGSNAVRWIDNVLGDTAYAINAGAIYQTSQINGLPAIQFSGTTAGRYTIPYPVMLANSTVFVVFNPSSFGRQDFISGGSGAYGLFVNTSGQLNLLKCYTADLPASTTTLTTGTWYQANVTYNSSTFAYSYRVARAAAGSGTSSYAMTSNTSGLGYDVAESNADFNSNLAEIIVYNRVLTGPEITTIENYLLAKYGI